MFASLYLNLSATEPSVLSLLDLGAFSYLLKYVYQGASSTHGDVEYM